MKTNKLKIMIKRIENSRTMTYFLIYPLISRCENIKILSEYSLHDKLSLAVPLHTSLEKVL